MPEMCRQPCRSRIRDKYPRLRRTQPFHPVIRIVISSVRHLLWAAICLELLKSTCNCARGYNRG